MYGRGPASMWLAKKIYFASRGIVDLNLVDDLE